MGTISPAVLQSGILIGTSATTVYTGVAAQVAVVKKATFCNTSASPVALTVYRIPNGGTLSATYEIIASRSLAVGETYVSPELANVVINSGDTIQAVAGTANVISAQISGYTQ